MSESFEYLDAVLRVWAKDNVQKILVKVLNRFEKQEEKRKSRFLFRKMTQKNRQQSQSAVKRD